MAKNEYQVYYQTHKNFLLEWFNRFKNWLIHILKKLFPNLHVNDKTLEWVSYGIMAAVVIIFLFLVVKVILKLVQERRYYTRPIHSNEDLHVSSQNHLNEAHHLAQKGDFRLALRHVFLSFILYLDENELITAKPWKTNWEYYDELNEQNKELADEFYLLALKFDEAIYGGRVINMDDYLSYREFVDIRMKDTSLLGANMDYDSDNSDRKGS